MIGSNVLGGPLESCSFAPLDRWQEALGAGVAPPVVLEATHALALEFSSLDDLRAHAAPV